MSVNDVNLCLPSQTHPPPPPPSQRHTDITWIERDFSSIKAKESSDPFGLGQVSPPPHLSASARACSRSHLCFIFLTSIQRCVAFLSSKFAHRSCGSVKSADWEVNRDRPLLGSGKPPSSRDDRLNHLRRRSLEDSLSASLLPLAA